MTFDGMKSTMNQNLSANRHKRRQVRSHRQDVEGNPLLTIEGVHKNFGSSKALRGVDLTVYPGDFAMITGPSGSGKTTLLSILNEEQTPCQGMVESKVPFEKIAIVFQDLRLIPEATVFENFTFSFYPQKRYGYKEFSKHAEELLEFFALKSLKKTKLKNLSGGEKQIVAVIRALLSGPDVLLLDEPTSALDEAKSKKLYDLVHLYNIKRNLTVIWATHDKDLAKKHTGKSVHLEKGKIIYTGRACFI